MELDSKSPDRPDRDAMGPSSLQSEAGESGQQAQVHHHRGGLRPGRRQPPRPAWPNSATTSSASASRIRPRRAHSIAAQGGINAAKNYQNDGDSVYRLFYDTVKGGDFRAREANVYRLAQISVNIIDQCVAQGVPFAREYGGYLDNRSFGGAQVSRTFYARGQTGQQLLLGAYQALERQIGAGTVKMYPRTEMLDLIVVDGRARGIVTRDLITGKIEIHFGRRRRARHRRLRQRLLPLHQRQGLQHHRHLARPQARRAVRQSLLHPDPPHLHPGLRRISVASSP